PLYRRVLLSDWPVWNPRWRPSANRRRNWRSGGGRAGEDTSDGTRGRRRFTYRPGCRVLKLNCLPTDLRTLQTDSRDELSLARGHPHLGAAQRLPRRRGALDGRRRERFPGLPGRDGKTACSPRARLELGLGNFAQTTSTTSFYRRWSR